MINSRAKIVIAILLEYDFKNRFFEDEQYRLRYTIPYKTIKTFLCDKLHHIVNLYLTYDSNERYIIILLINKWSLK